MTSENSRSGLLLQAMAAAEVEATEDIQQRELLKIFYTAALVEFMKKGDQTDAAWESARPAADFDLQFFVRVVRRALSNPAALLEILDQAEASVDASET